MAKRDSHFCLPDVGEMSHQPVCHSFPKCTFGKTKVGSRAFQGMWFGKWQWLFYNSLRNLAFCDTCVSAVKAGKMKMPVGNLQDSAFLSRGFSNWKDASKCFSSHEKTSTHKTAVD